MKLKLPRLIREEKVGNSLRKNIIIHLVCEEVEKDFEIVSFQRGKVILKDLDGTEFYITTSKNDVPENQNFVLLSKSFLKKDIESGNITFIKWLKHPNNIEHRPTDIVNSWGNAFNFKEEDLGNELIGLRKPQIGAIHSILGHLTNANEIATVVLPTGTGKTETMLSVLVAGKCNKLLVTVPSDALRSQLAGKFYDLGWLKKGDSEGNSIVSSNAKYPKVGIVNTGFRDDDELNHFLDKCNVIVSTMDLMTSMPIKQANLISEKCSHLFVDEAHHSKAKSWNRFINFFDKNKVVLFTATPYRNDGQLLDGKIIYNFTLKEAQEQGYFKEIDFIPIREYDQKTADLKIAEVAVNKLREDITNGYEHILMARCENKLRADEVFEIYSKHTDLNPIKIYSNLKGQSNIKQNIINKQHKIIVCVDMLGEGFDLPELKIAAFHDARKSLPITLQFAGRFTRTNKDNNLGKASFVANLYQPSLSDELSLLYAKESNWNSILPTLSLQATQEQIDLQDFLSGFNHLDESIIPFQEIRPAFSSVVYKNQTDDWHPMNFKAGIKGYENYDYKFHDLNRDRKTLIVFLGNKKPVDWGSFKDVYNIEWNIYIVYWEQSKNLLFIHSSDKGSHYKELANAIIGNSSILIKDEDVFKTFYNIDRVKLFNLGLRKGLGKDITFQSYYGKGVQEGLTLAEEKSGINNNVFGVGFENGDITSIGCSRKGRIWSYSRGTINQFLDWCDEIAIKLTNDEIDPNEILLKNTIKPERVSIRPNAYPISVDWHHEIYKTIEDKVVFNIKGIDYDLSSIELNTFNPDNDNPLSFSLDTDSDIITFQLNLSEVIVNGNRLFSFNMLKTSTIEANVKMGSKIYSVIEFFNEFPPKFWFHDGSNLQGNEYVKFNEEILEYPKEEIEVWNWTGVDINKESEGFGNINNSSIQYFCIEKLIHEDYDLIYNDDNSGEIADIVAIKNTEKEILIDLFHLKFALRGVVSSEIKNFYEVCGQAQKSLVWKYKESLEFFNHLMKREYKKQKQGQTRIRKGNIELLEKLLFEAKWNKELKFQVIIVQPGFSKETVTPPILNLLGVTSNHLKKEGGIDLKVISS
ncbi:restriction endonuclease subunit R [Riemerella anatipestifer]|uniref:DEAD/DEAH box helicase n=1 Tax=Riemerella anatipestifer TaxID=34085 RepID=UPI000D143D9A|nr:DEAD/DEAH box helicase family protein [Riemerella anatipestifer]PST44381.1 restriction endonuclease subunit R [Riemerella anatipestifer]